jgi:hypothetical protein
MTHTLKTLSIGFIIGALSVIALNSYDMAIKIDLMTKDSLRTEIQKEQADHLKLEE